MIGYNIVGRWQAFRNWVSQEIQVQKQRYSRTAYGKIVAFLMYCAAFIFFPPLVDATVSFLAHYMALKYVYIVVILSTITAVALIYNISLWFIYKAKLPFFEQYRVNPDKPWPWEQDSSKWSKFFWRSVAINAACIYLVGGLSLLAEANLDFSIQMNPDNRLDLKWILLQFFLMMLMEDLVFFTTHYALHQPFLYKYHKIHHEYTTSVSLAGLHFHYIQFFFTQSLSNLTCIKLASIVGPFSLSTLVIWITFRVLDAFNGHCGYVFSWTPLQLLPFCTNDQFHDFHHTQNCGNYGSHFRFWDTIFDTNRVFREYKKKQRKLQAQKKQL